MNRRNFFKNLGAATVGVIVAPAVVVKALDKTSKESHFFLCDRTNNIANVMKMWRENGVLLYKANEENNTRLYVDGQRVPEWREIQPYKGTV